MRACAERKRDSAQPQDTGEASGKDEGAGFVNSCTLTLASSRERGSFAYVILTP